MDDRVLRLEGIARRLRLHTLDALFEAQSGHPGSSLSIADIVASLYFGEMRISGEGRDRCVLSKGHGVAALYAAFSELGWLFEGELQTLRKVESRLQGHPDMTRLPHLDAGTGALGQGLSIAIGYALAARLQQSGSRAYCIIGDGECQEGQIWEGAMYAGARRIDNLVAIMDHNGFQNEDSVEETLPMHDLYGKWASFGWHVIELDGHDLRQILNAFDLARATSGKPSLLLCHTVKGKGVPFMENDKAWHSRTLSPAEYQEATAYLKSSGVEGAGVTSHG